MAVYSKSSNAKFQQIIEGTLSPGALSVSDFWTMWVSLDQNEKTFLIASLGAGDSGLSPVLPAAIGARTTTARTAGTTITAGFTRATVTWLGGGTGTLTVDGIPWDMSVAGSVEYDSEESGSDVVITTTTADTYYTTVVA